MLLASHSCVCNFDSLQFRHFQPENGNVVVPVILSSNLAINIGDCLSLCLSKDTLKAIGPFYLVSMPGEVKDPTPGVNV